METLDMNLRSRPYGTDREDALALTLAFTSPPQLETKTKIGNTLTYGSMYARGLRCNDGREVTTRDQAPVRYQRSGEGAKGYSRRGGSFGQ